MARYEPAGRGAFDCFVTLFPPSSSFLLRDPPKMGGLSQDSRWLEGRAARLQVRLRNATPS